MTTQPTDKDRIDERRSVRAGHAIVETFYNWAARDRVRLVQYCAVDGFGRTVAIESRIFGFCYDDFAAGKRS